MPRPILRARQRCSVCSDTSNWFATTATSCPSPRRRSASRNFLMICSGECRRRLDDPTAPIALLAHASAVRLSKRPDRPHGVTPEVGAQLDDVSRDAKAWSRRETRESLDTALNTAGAAIRAYVDAANDAVGVDRDGRVGVDS
jgi:hypothetical protein